MSEKKFTSIQSNHTTLQSGPGNILWQPHRWRHILYFTDHMTKNDVIKWNWRKKWRQDRKHVKVLPWQPGPSFVMAEMSCSAKKRGKQSLWILWDHWLPKKRKVCQMKDTHLVSLSIILWWSPERLQKTISIQKKTHKELWREQSQKQPMKESKTLVQWEPCKNQYVLSVVYGA